MSVLVLTPVVSYYTSAWSHTPVFLHRVFGCPFAAVLVVQRTIDIIVISARAEMEPAELNIAHSSRASSGVGCAVVTSVTPSWDLRGHPPLSVYT